MPYWRPKDKHQSGQYRCFVVTTEGIINRIQEATGTQNMFELACWLGVRVALISDVKRQNRMPASWLQMLILNKSDCNPEWILTGGSR